LSATIPLSTHLYRLASKPQRARGIYPGLLNWEAESAAS
jgi:hypothetical protein